MDPGLDQAVAACLEGNDPQGAIRLLEQSLQHNPAQAAAWAKLGEIYFNIDELDRALHAESQAIQYEPIAERYNARSVTLREAGRRQEQLADLNQAVAVEPGATEHRRARMWLLMTMGYLDQALADAEENMRLAPDRAWFPSDRGRVLAQMGRYPEALESLEQAIAKDPAEATYHRFKSSILCLGGRAHEAVRAAHVALALEPNDGRNYRVRSLAYAALDREGPAAKDRATATRVEDESD